MTDSFIFLTILAALCTFYIGVSYFISKSIHSKKDFFLGGRSFGVFPIAATLLATQVGGGMFLGTAQEPIDGYAVGGSMGKDHTEMFAMLTKMMPYIPTDKPNHLLGFGDLFSLEEGVKLGCDTFDSSHPTRCARHGLLFTKSGIVKIMNARYQNDFTPLDANCGCYTCKHYTKAYLRHLFKSHELTAYSLTSLHNIYFMTELMAKYRNMILNDEI